MIFKRLYFRVVIQVILLLAGCLTLSLVWDQSGLLYIRVTLVALIILQTGLMIRYLNKSNKRLLQFFTAVNAGDFSTSFSVKNIEPEFEELNHQLSKLSKYFNELKFDYEQQNAFYRAAIEHVGVGIFGFDDTDNVAFSNNSLHRTFGISHLRNLKNLDNIQNGTAEFFRKLVPHKTTLLEFNQEGNIYQLAVRSNNFKSPGKNLVLVSVQNIKPELEDREVEAWQKMIRVLTHEIMNSVSPISSLAESLNRLSEKEKLNTTWFESEKSRDKLGKGLETIQRRSTG
nr:hypothetical protein [Bacteroidota bacterium]